MQHPTDPTKQVIQRDPFTNNMIPQSLQHPSIKTFADIMLSLPNLPGLTRNFINTASASNDRDYLVMRGDHRAGDKDTFSVRYLHQNVGQLDPQSNPYLATQTRVDHRNLSAQWNHLLSPSSILEVRFGYNNPLNPDCALNSKTGRGEFLDATGIQLFQREVLCDVIPTLESEGEFSFGGGGTAIDEKNWQFVSNFSKVTGSHSLKFGVNYTRRHFFTDTANPMNGNAWFNSTLTSDPYTAAVDSKTVTGFSTASMALGLPRQIRRATGQTITNARINAWQYFAQDDWRITSKLTFNLGLRYEWNNAPYDTSDNLGNLCHSRSSDGPLRRAPDVGECEP